MEISEDNLKKLVLKTKDGRIYEVMDDFRRLSGLVNNFLEDNENAPYVPIVEDSCTNEVMSDILRYYEHYRGEINILSDLDSDKKKLKVDKLSEWDAQLLDRPYEQIYPLLVVANYFDMTHFIDILCQKIADGFKGLTHIEMREKFNIKNDFTPDEERQVMIENGWIEPTDEDKKKFEELRKDQEGKMETTSE